MQGTIITGPVSASGYIWRYVDFDTGVDGWTAQTVLVLIAGSPPPPPPPPQPPPSGVFSVTAPVGGAMWPLGTNIVQVPALRSGYQGTYTSMHFPISGLEPQAITG